MKEYKTEKHVTATRNKKKTKTKPKSKKKNTHAGVQTNTSEFIFDMNTLTYNAVVKSSNSSESFESDTSIEESVKEQSFEDPLNSDDDVSEDNDEDNDTDNIIVCLYEKVLMTWSLAKCSETWMYMCMHVPSDLYICQRILCVCVCVSQETKITVDVVITFISY